MRLGKKGNSGHVVSWGRNMFAQFEFKYSNKFRTFTLTIINTVFLFRKHSLIANIKTE